MELRHLRYFVAVAEEGSVTAAAERRLYTSQPSLSRQLQALEDEVGTPLLLRGSRGITLTAAGKVFLDHARLALAQVDAAGHAAREAAAPSKPRFALGFLTGQEMEWLPHAMRVLGGELARVDISVSSLSSPGLADDLLRRKLDVAFMRREPGRPELEYLCVAQEPLLVVLPSDHRLAAQDSIDIRQLTGEVFIGMSDTAPVLQGVLDDYFQRIGIELLPHHHIDNLAMAISMVASTRGVTLLPSYALNFLPWSVISRPISGEAPTIELMLGYRKADTSPLLKLFVANFRERAASGRG
ncbi:LysR family transcriptional regulator [Rugamonas sp.]|uniref:LysR family transcriptional regulator n=1 Tax=Rugamonas sp. TaxID=1926287 RepID=UPI0025D1FA32|nr:LysR family transcriptional regulator [Rugamonas sp.]